jgi:Kef-type K+ transport system membrane component KefB
MTTQSAIALLLLTIGALIIPLLSERIGIPAAAGEMLYGALLGNATPRLAQYDSHGLVAGLAEFGFLLLLFLTGLELNFTLLRRRGWPGILRLSIPALGILALAYLLVRGLHLPTVYGLMIGVSSASVALVVLHELGLEQAIIGQTILVTAMIGEFASIILLTNYDLLHQYGLGLPMLIATGKLILLLTVGLAFLIGLAAAVWWRPASFSRLVVSHDPMEVGVRAAIALMVAFAAVAVLLGVEQILAAFMAGAIVAYVFRGQLALSKKLAALAHGFFVPIFFVSVGLQISLPALLQPHGLMLLGILLGGTLAIRLLVIPLLRMAGLRWREAGRAALLLAAPLTLQVAAARVGADLGLLTHDAVAQTLGAAVIGATIYPTLFRHFSHRAARSLHNPTAAHARSGSD